MVYYDCFHSVIAYEKIACGNIPEAAGIFLLQTKKFQLILEPNILFIP